MSVDMSILENVLHPQGLEHFKENFLFKQPFAAPDRAHAFKNLINWNLLQEIFRAGRSDIWLPRYGQLPDNPELNTGSVPFAQACQHFGLGRTILVRHAEKSHRDLAAIASDFEQLFHKAVDIQVYCTPPQEEGFDWHFDFEDVFVIQSYGVKEFRLRKNKLSREELKGANPVQGFHEFSDPTEIRCLLTAGDWLYIPSGYWHKANALSTSFHLSIGVMF